MINAVTFIPKNIIDNNQQYAYRAILQAIMQFDLEPGQHISDSELAEALNISRTPVREAIVRLVELKLIEVLPQKYSCVSRINLDYVDEGVFLRQVLESAVMKVAAEKASAEDLAALRENLSLQRLRIDERRYKEYVELDDEFHKIIYLAAGKSRSWDAVVMVTTHLNRLRRLQNLVGSETLEAGCNEHFLIYDRIVAKDMTGIDEFVKAHITSGYQTVLPRLKVKHPEYFE